MPVGSAEKLHSLVSRILLAAGADQRNADRVADALVASNLRGVDTHGVLHLPRYVEQINSGRIVPTAWPEIMKETGTTALVTGNWTFGHVATKYAMDIAIEKAREHNVATVGVVKVNHIGRLGEYAEMAAAQGMAALVWASGYGQEAPMTVPYGGREPLLNTNPLAMGFPAGDEPPMIIDYATTTVAGSKVLLARMRNQQLPPGSVVDKDGNSSTDPSVMQEGGSYVAFGGHKGYAIMLANEFLGRILTGSDDYLEGERGGPTFRHQGVTLMVFRADAFQPLADFKSRADDMSRRARAIAPAPGFDEVLMPGDPESRARATRGRDGIPVPDDVWKPMIDLAESLNVAVD